MKNMQQKDGSVIVYDADNKIIKNESITSNSNGISFTKQIGCEEYIIKIIADYDLDTDAITTGDNEYKNQELLAQNINISQNRLFEVKDITGATLYRNNGDIAEEVTHIEVSELQDLSNYIVKVRTKAMPSFYAKIKGYKEVNNKLEFILDYKDAIQYTGDMKSGDIKVVYGEGNNGIYENRSIKDLINEINADLDGTVTLTQDYDASMVTNNDIALLADEFRGTLDGNGHKIIGLTKPLFNSVSGEVKNLVLENVNLSGASSQGAIANTATNMNVTNVHIKGIKFKTGINKSGVIFRNMCGWNY